MLRGNRLILRTSTVGQRAASTLLGGAL